MFLKKPTIATKGILGSFNEIFLFSASLAFPQNRSIPLFSPRYVGEHPALEPIQEDQSPLALVSLLSLLCSRVLATQLAGVQRQDRCLQHPTPSQSWSKRIFFFFWRREYYIVQPGKCVFCTLFPHTQTFVDR